MGPALEWFALIPKGSIKSWDDLANKFVENYAYNIENDVTIATLCHLTQDEGEPFINCFQRWCNMAT